MTTDPTGLDWVQQNVLPPMWRDAQAAEELRTCYCQAPPSDWLGGTIQPEACLWDREGRNLAWSRYADGTYCSGLIRLWRTNGVCTRRTA